MSKPTPDITQFKPAYDRYPTSYSDSWSEIEFKHIDHGHIRGSARRTGLTPEDWPVYQFSARCSPEVNGCLVALSPDGFVFLRRAAQEA